MDVSWLSSHLLECLVSLCAAGQVWSVRTSCQLCEKPFYRKQKSICCGECNSRFHCNCLPTCVPETNVSAFMCESAYKSDSCMKLMGDAANEHSFSKSNQKEAISTELQCTASRIGDKYSLCAAGNSSR